jgi:hypothetical protein
MNFPKRVPVLAKPQEGSSIRNRSSALNTFSFVVVSIRDSPRQQFAPAMKVTIFVPEDHGFLRVAWRNFLRLMTGSAADLTTQGSDTGSIISPER